MLNLRKQIVAILVICVLSASLTTGALAKVTYAQLVETPDLKVVFNGIEYNLSELPQAKAYLEASGQLQSIGNSVTFEELYKFALKADKATRGLPRNSTFRELFDKSHLALILDRTTTHSSEKTYTPSISLQSTSIFDLETRLRTNSQAVLDVYYSTFILALALNPLNIAGAAAIAYAQASVFFTLRVREGGEWDFKRTLGATTHQLTSIDRILTVMLGEDIGNVHFGFVGSTLFPPLVLRTAAGFVQILSGTAEISWFRTYFDDPRDQIAIQRGIDYFNTSVFVEIPLR